MKGSCLRGNQDVLETSSLNSFKNRLISIGAIELSVCIMTVMHLRSYAIQGSGVSGKH